MIRFAGCSLLLAVFFGCSSANQAAGVDVDYKQVANFHEFVSGSDSSGSYVAGDDMFVMYKVVSIKNSGSMAQSFTFDPSKVATVTDKTSNVNAPATNLVLGTQYVSTVTVAPGASQTVNKCFIKQVATSNPASIGVDKKVNVVYDINANQPVTMHDKNAGGVSFVGNGTPSSLQQLCSSK